MRTRTATRGGRIQGEVGEDRAARQGESLRATRGIKTLIPRVRGSDPPDEGGPARLRRTHAEAVQGGHGDRGRHGCVEPGMGTATRRPGHGPSTGHGRGHEQLSESGKMCPPLACVHGLVHGIHGRACPIHGPACSLHGRACSFHGRRVPAGSPPMPEVPLPGHRTSLSNS